MKAMVGTALALSLALVGCQGNENQGGGGGTTADKQTQAERTDERAGTMGRDTTEKLQQQTHDNLRDATKNASEARTSVAKKDWPAAKDNLDEVQDDLNSVVKDIHPSKQAEVTQIRAMADKAHASVKNHSANAQQDIDRLVAGLNKFTTSEVKAGGGKPTQKK